MNELIIPHNRLKTNFTLDQVMEHTKAAYESITKKTSYLVGYDENSFLIDDFNIEIFDPISFSTVCGAKCQGRAYHERKKALIKENDFVILMTAIGHEIGHLTTACFSNDVREEAKAYAFAYAWTKDIASRHPDLMTDYESEISCPVFYSFEEIEQLIARDLGYEIHNNPFNFFNKKKWSYDLTIHDYAKEIVAVEIKKSISAMDVYHMLLDDKIPMPIMAQTGIVGITRDRFYQREKK